MKQVVAGNFSHFYNPESKQKVTSLNFIDSDGEGGTITAKLTIEEGSISMAVVGDDEVKLLAILKKQEEPTDSWKQDFAGFLTKLCQHRRLNVNNNIWILVTVNAMTTTGLGQLQSIMDKKATEHQLDPAPPIQELANVDVTDEPPPAPPSPSYQVINEFPINGAILVLSVDTEAKFNSNCRLAWNDKRGIVLKSGDVATVLTTIQKILTEHKAHWKS